MDELKTWSIKILIPALAGLSIKLAMMAAHNKLSWFNATTSVIIGLATAALLGSLIIHNVSPEYAPLYIAAVTILSEKVCYWLLYKFNIESVLETVVEKLKTNK